MSAAENLAAPSDLITPIRGQFPYAIVGSHQVGGDQTIILKRENLLAVMQYLRDDAAMAFEQLVDVTATDFAEFDADLRHFVSPLDDGLSAQLPRYEVVYHLLSISRAQRLRVKVPLSESDSHLPSLCGLWIAANWGERETWDMYGIKFDNHPDLRRILMYEEFEGHPLRKDYPLRGYQPLVPMPDLADYKDNENYR